MKVYADGTAPSLTMDDGAGASVTLDCGANGVQLKQDAAVPFLITLPPTAFAKGFTVTVTDVKGGHMEVSTSKKNTVKNYYAEKVIRSTFFGRAESILKRA